ncbi:DUF6197 family protein [Aurantiacibacter hainanensis]|uniref:DUF6197 family protein n=1 Tax=Aurantiacibacter hainanensis TaxID=3076114 RepID=UPI0030C6E273
MAGALGLAAMLPACAATPSTGPRSCAIDYADMRDRELAIIETAEEILSTVSESEPGPEQMAQLERGLALLGSRERVVDSLDLSIIESAAAMLASEDLWDWQDDRQCARADATISLFCALQFASIDATGSYQHRRTGLQEVRLALQDATPGRDYAHRLRDFNNDPRTSLEDVRAVLDTAYARVEYRLAMQQACEWIPPLMEMDLAA